MTPLTPRAADVHSLRTTLDRGREDNLIKYQSSITSILGESIDASIFAGDSVAGASIFEDLSVARRGDASSIKKGLDPPASRLPVYKNHDVSIAKSFNSISRSSKRSGSPLTNKNLVPRSSKSTDDRRGTSSSTKKKLDPPCSPTRILKSNAGNSHACTSTRDGGVYPGRNSKRMTIPGRNDYILVDSAAAKKKLNPPSFTLPVRKGNGNGHTPKRHLVCKSNDGSGHANTARHNASATKNTSSFCSDDTPIARYQVGDTRASRAHSLPFDSPSQASAVLAQLPLQSRLFVRRSDRNFTYAVLVDRRDSGRNGGTSLVVALDQGGKRTKVLERRHWEMCLRLVNTGVVDNERCQ